MNFLANQHPILVHFPIAFLILYMALEVVNLFFKNATLNLAANSILFLGIIGGIASVLSGNLEYQYLVQKVELTEIYKFMITKHEQSASLTLWYFLFVLVAKIYFTLKRKNESRLQYLFVIFSLIGFYLIYKTAKLGGYLVYEYGLGTKLIE